jgi:hypothetical protein
MAPDDGLWRIAISGSVNPVTALDVGGAIKPATELRDIGEDALRLLSSAPWRMHGGRRRADDGAL